MLSSWRVPPYVQAILRSLHFTDPSASGLQRFTDSEWKKALAFCDRNHLTLELARRCFGAAPPDVAERLASNLANNNVRLEKLESAYREIAASFDRAGVDWIVLKGFSHWPGIGRATRARPQYDIDLYCSSGCITDARQAIDALGYRPLAGFDHIALDHLPTMVRPHNWTWRSDFFDVDIPVYVDLHHRLWDFGTERIEVIGMGGFWDRRVKAIGPDFRFPALSVPDLIGYAALHLLRHLLRGDLRPFHVYDIAWFLHTRWEDDAFWREWSRVHHQSLQRLELVVFRLAEVWFGCRLPPLVEAGIADLPSPVQRWLTRDGGSPLEAQFHPNKRELSLHLSLLDRSIDRRAVFMRRVLPSRLPPPAEARLESKQFRFGLYARKLITRSIHHLKALIPACVLAFKWWCGQAISSRTRMMRPR